MSKGPEVQLNLTHTVTIMGLVIGCLVVAFVIGYRSGRITGYEEAASSTLANVPRFRIPDTEQPTEVSEEFVQKVYSRLQKNIEGPRDEPTPPKLEKINQVLPSATKEISKEKKKLGDIANEAQAAEKKKIKKKKVKPQAVITAEKIVTEKVEQTEKKAVVSEQKPNEQVTNSGATSKGTLGGLFELSNSATNKKENVEKNRVLPVKPVKPRSTPIPEKAKVKLQPMEQATPSQALTRESTPVSPGWYVQVAASAVRIDADNLISKLRQNGFRDSVIQSAVVRGKTYYRVLVGPEDTSVLAQRLLEQLKREPYVKFKPYLKRVS